MGSCSTALLPRACKRGRLTFRLLMRPAPSAAEPEQLAEAASGGGLAVFGGWPLALERRGRCEHHLGSHLKFNKGFDQYVLRMVIGFQVFTLHQKLRFSLCLREWALLIMCHPYHIGCASFRQGWGPLYPCQTGTGQTDSQQSVSRWLTPAPSSKEFGETLRKAAVPEQRGCLGGSASRHHCCLCSGHFAIQVACLHKSMQSLNHEQLTRATKDMVP